MTAVSARPGEPVVDGDVVASIDDIDRRALATSQPFHRELAIGASGDDVAELNGALVRLGYGDQLALDSAGRRFTHQTVRAVGEFAQSLGVAEPTGSFDPAWVVWLPASPYVASSTNMTVGAPAPPAGSVLGDSERVLVAAVATSPDPARALSLPDVDHVVALAGSSFDLDERAGAVEDAALPSLAASLASNRSVADSTPDTVSAVVKYANAQAGWGVVASAVVESSERACIFVDDLPPRAVAVEIIGTEAGRTVVTGDVSQTDEYVADPSPGLARLC